jgi:putative transposase
MCCLCKLLYPVYIEGQTLPVIPGRELKKRRIAHSQIVAVLKEGDAAIPMVQLMRKHGLIIATHFTWRLKQADIGVGGLKHVRKLETAIVIPKRVCAAPVLDSSAIKDVLSRRL